VSIFKHRWLTTGSWKNASGVLQSSAIFCNRETGNTDTQTQTAFVVDTEDWCGMLRGAHGDMRTVFIAVFTTIGFCTDFPVLLTLPA